MIALDGTSASGKSTNAKLVAKALGERLSGENSRGGFLVATGLDVSIDGLLIGVAFSIGTDTGGLLVLAFTLELAALGLALGASGTRSLRHSVGTAALLALPVLPAAVVGVAYDGSGTSLGLMLHYQRIVDTGVTETSQPASLLALRIRFVW